jgi:hypothetical protein
MSSPSIRAWLRLDRGRGVPTSRGRGFRVRTTDHLVCLAAASIRDASLYGVATPYTRLDWQRGESELRRIAIASGGAMYIPLSMLDLSGIYAQLMEILRTHYVITYRSCAAPEVSGSRAVRVEPVDSATGGPLVIADTDGKPARSRSVAEQSYDPRRVTAAGSS